MKITRFDDPLQFQTRVKDFLVENEAENNLQLGILSSVVAGEYTEHTPYLALVEDGGHLQLVLMRTPPYPVLFSYLDKPIEKEMVQLITDDLFMTYGDELTGMTGKKDVVATLAEAWHAATGKKPVLKMAMRIYKLEEVIPVSGTPGRMRPANKADKKLLLEWYHAFHLDALQEEPEHEQVKKQVDRYLTADPDVRGLMIWEVQNQPANMVGYAGPTTNGIRIGAVYTPTDLRRRGYATACVANISSYLLDKGYKFCFLFTDLLNPTSNHIYQQVGYVPVSDVDTYNFK
jgi:predicted GNAT family acetyltransferase